MVLGRHPLGVSDHILCRTLWCLPFCRLFIYVIKANIYIYSLHHTRCFSKCFTWTKSLDSHSNQNYFQMRRLRHRSSKSLAKKTQRISTNAEIQTQTYRFEVSGTALCEKQVRDAYPWTHIPGLLIRVKLQEVP